MQQNGKIRVVMVGGSGYAGFEALRWMARHPNVELVGIFGPPSELGPMEEFYPILSGMVSLSQELFEPGRLAGLGADLAMLCVPHKVAMSYVPALRDAGLRVIDWSADYRFRDQATYEKWYQPHSDAARLGEAVYGLPEHFAEQIRSADVIGNPGCYPTSVILPLAAVIRTGLIRREGIVASSVTGISGAGRTPNLKFHFPERNENFEPYGIGGHRHQPEMESILQTVCGGEVSVLFQPHLAPMDRGILTTIYADPAGEGVTTEQVLDALESAYAGKPFVRIRRKVAPATKYVTGTNFCDIGACVTKGKVILFSALDNMIKGASGQAIQNMNLMFGLDETTGLF